MVTGIASCCLEGYRDDVSEGFQPGGRAPAPPPLDLVQDFVNTEIPEWARDDIATPGLLESWLRGRGLLSDDEGVDAASFVAARELRSALRALALLNTLGRRPPDRALDELRRALRDISLGVEPDADGRLAVVGAGAGAQRALAAIVAVVVEGQASGSWPRLKACRQETCGWVFFDASRNASSTWCSMSVCGSRAKSASYRRRRKASS
ncbi:MAG TPA: CGNR zinc finger domain-containing protein [Gaiellaceae bacterium]|jgi:predicted RNA-binding Zn ribbon-like protein|nr:CGNR zinc finger domain-containing protein [Gaiellaceae bacterium]